MKRTAKTAGEQFNLSLISTPALAVAQDKQNELKRALIELLTSTALPAGEIRDHRRGDEDESQTND